MSADGHSGDDLPTLSAECHEELLDILFGPRTARATRLAALLARPGVDAVAVRAHVAFHYAMAEREAAEADDALLPPPRESDRFPRAGALFGRYRILAPVTEGGMGAVYLAQDEELHRRVALKVIRPDRLAQPGARERFRREARAVANLRHASICTVYEVGTVGDVPFLAMEFVDGPSLSAVLTKRREESAGGRVGSSGLPTTHAAVSAVLLMIELVAEALHLAHEAGVVHRDVKPGNILVDRAGKPILIDFGLAREQASTGDRTLTGAADVLGTPPYMSPEQVRPRGKVDRRTDVYSLAVTLFECLTLHHPFVAQDHMSLFERIERDATPDPRGVNPALPADLAAVLQKAMEKEPARRYATALEFADDLRRVRNLQPTHARRIGPIGRLLRWSRRNRLAAGVGGAMAGAVGVIAVLLALSNEQRQALAAETRESAARALLGAAAREVANHPNLALDLACRSYAALPGAEALEQVRAALDACAELATMRAHTDYVLNSALTADGSLAVTGSYDGTVRSWNRKGEELRRFDVGDNVTDLWLLPDARTVLVTTAFGGNGPADPPRGRALRLDLATGDTTELDAGPVPRFAIVPVAGGRVAIAAADGVLRVVGGGAPRDYAHGVAIWKLAVSPRRAELVATSDYARKVRVFDLAAEDQAPLFELTTTGYVDALALSPTRDELLLGDREGNVRVVPLDGGPQVSMQHGSPRGAYVRAAAWSADGERLLTVGDDARGWLWSRSGALLAQLIGHFGPVYCCRELPDGTGWATGGDDGTIRLWSNRGLALRELRGHASAISGGLSFAADGATLLSAGTDATARVWDLSAERAGLLHSPSGGFMTAQFVPGTSRVVATTDDGHVVQWDDAGHMTDLVLPAHTFTGSAVFRPDGRLVVGQFGGAMHVVDLAVNEIERTWRPDDRHDAGARLPSILADGRVMVLQQMWGGYPATLRCTDKDLGEQHLVAALPPGLIVHTFACSPDGARIYLACGDGSVRLVRGDGSVGIAVPAVEGGLTGIALSPDGRWLATGGTEMLVRLYEVAADGAAPPREARVLRGHHGDILGVRFAPDGRRLVTTSRDRTARVWSIDGALLATLRGHLSFVYDACWSPDGTRILTASSDGTLRSWLDDARALLEHARARVLPVPSGELEPYRDILGKLGVTR